MSRALDDLLNLLALEPLDDGLYRGQSMDLGFGAVFGGQVMGQALAAAKYTLAPERPVHSFHSYFLRPGDVNKPIIYDVENIRDGKTISTRRVQALQYGKPIFYMTASFQQPVAGFEHQALMPDVPGPDGLTPESERLAALAEQVPPRLRKKLLAENPIDMRQVNYVDPMKPEKAEPRRCVWLRANGTLPDDLRIHKYLLAYASDFNFLPTALMPHGHSFWERQLQVATIDHSMWYHDDFRFDDWVLYVMESPRAIAGRGLVQGQLYSRDGRLVATAVQEGLIRPRDALAGENQSFRP
ncbi:acyl-CoA thioesterase II [Oceanimonas sp. CHS3-5]|uniref:acyl-CoA thioesterase II n=1 Tax=Oceanimonas sp. CHS3-5 TaxID=3068186 RepID=UPI00273DA85F|nr:acyl-CoA thioesterase II [Oceanimonas sp. CHS3-5]MDP5291609.1 acyl-CoA thioesterase II [Oceanimonas sp. CHS3-5]